MSWKKNNLIWNQGEDLKTWKDNRWKNTPNEESWQRLCGKAAPLETTKELISKGSQTSEKREHTVYEFIL